MLWVQKHKDPINLYLTLWEPSCPRIITYHEPFLLYTAYSSPAIWHAQFFEETSCWCSVLRSPWNVIKNYWNPSKFDKSAMQCYVCTRFSTHWSLINWHLTNFNWYCSRVILFPNFLNPFGVRWSDVLPLLKVNPPPPRAGSKRKYNDWVPL